MSYKEFWEDDPEIFWAYRFFYYKNQEQELEKINFSAWIYGLYSHYGVSLALANSFREKGKQPENYLEKPINLFGAKENNKLEEEITNYKLIEEQKIKIRALQIENMLKKK